MGTRPLSVLVIARTVAVSFQSISKDLLSQYLNLEAEELTAFVREQGWIETEDSVQVPVNKDNDARTTVIRENIRFERTHSKPCQLIALTTLLATCWH